MDSLLDWHHFDDCLFDHPRDVLLYVLHGIVLGLGHLSRHLLYGPSLLVFRYCPLHWHSLDPLPRLVVYNPVLEGNILDSALACLNQEVPLITSPSLT